MRVCLPGRHRAIIDHRRDVRRTLARLLIRFQRERPDLPGTVALLAVFLDDRRDILRECRPRGLRNLGQRTSNRLDVILDNALAGEECIERILQIVCRGIHVPLLPSGVLVIDPPAITHLALAVDHDGLGRHLDPQLPCEHSVLVARYRKLQAEVTPWVLTSESLKSGSTQTPTHLTFSAEKLSTRLLSVGL